MSRLELGLEVMLTRNEVVFLSSLVWAVHVAGLAIERLVLGIIIYNAFHTLFPTSCSLSNVFLSPNWYESNRSLSRHRKLDLNRCRISTDAIVTPELN